MLPAVKYAAETPSSGPRKDRRSERHNQQGRYAEEQPNVHVVDLEPVKFKKFFFHRNEYGQLL